MANNPPAIGSNTPDAIDYAREVSDRLQLDYAELTNTTIGLEAEANAIPDAIPDAATKEVVVDLIKRIRDTKVRVEGMHVLEKQPYLRRGQGVDQFFFGLWDRLMKRDKNNRNGIGDALVVKLTAYDVRVLAEEQERRRKIAEEAARVERERLAAVAKAEAEAEQARLAAERARKPETAAAKEAAAVEREDTAASARVEATVATAAAEAAHVETLARPADVIRTRTSAGTLATMAQETYAEIEDASKLDPAVLWPYVKYEAKQAALNAWAKSTDHRQQMAGAKVGRRPKSLVR